MKTPSFLRSRSPFCWLPLGLCLLASGLGMHPARADEVTRQVQEELRKRKLYFGDVDGRLSDQVAAALRRYQERKGFATTGEPDETTLRSLSLTVASLPQNQPPANGDGASTGAPPPGPGPTPWPDIAVLRSDLARITPRTSAGVNPGAITAADAAAGADPLPTPSPTPTPAPPPSAAAAVRRPGAAEVRAFVERYLRAGANNDLPAEMSFYADQVDYFDDGPVDRRYIRADVARYDHRWPERQFTLLDGLTFDATETGQTDRTVVNCRVRFSAKRPGYNVQGETDNVYTLVGNSPQDWRIAGLKEQRVRTK